MLCYARGLEIAACPRQRSRNQGAGHRRTPRQPRCRHGVKIGQWEQEDPLSGGLAMIDDFRLRGSRTWRRRGGPLIDGGGSTQVVHFVSNHGAFLSEGRALAGVVGNFAEAPHQTRDNTNSSRLMRPSEARLRLAGPPPARRNGAPHERGAGGESAPPFLSADAPSEQVKWSTLRATTQPSSEGVALTTEIPGGKAIERCRGQGRSTDRSSPRLPPSR